MEIELFVRDWTLDIKMIILHASDIHFDKGLFNEITFLQNDVDVICISGDFLKEINYNEVAYIKEWARSLTKPLFTCSGNYDVEIDDGEWLKEFSFSDTTIKKIDGVKFGCVPYLGAFWSDFCECDVLLTHVPPNCLVSKENKKEFGDKELKEALENYFFPKYLLCGHVHNPIKKVDKINKTTIYNNAGRVFVFEY